MILEKGDQVLLLQRSQNATYEPGSFTLPSGSKEDGETPLESAVRETREEVGVDVNQEETTLVPTMARRKPDGEEWVDYFFATTTWEGQPQVMEPDKCQGVIWVDPHSLPEQTIPFIRQALENYKNNIPYSEFGYDEQ